MSKPRSRRPASEARPTRRSLVELTAAAVNGVTEASVPETLPATPTASPDEGAPVEQVTKITSRMAESSPTDRPAAAEAPAAIRAANAAVPDKYRDLRRQDSSTEIAVKIAKDYQAWVLDDIKLSMNAALDFAGSLAKAQRPADAASMAAGREEESIASALDAAAEYRAKAFDLMQTNMSATLDFARQLIGVKTPAEFVELSGTHARKQCELVLEQTSALRSFAQTMKKDTG